MTNRHAQAEHVSNTTTAPLITPTRNVAHTIDQTLARNRGRERYSLDQTHCHCRSVDRG